MLSRTRYIDSFRVARAIAHPSRNKLLKAGESARPAAQLFPVRRALQFRIYHLRMSPAAAQSATA